MKIAALRKHTGEARADGVRTSGTIKILGPSPEKRDGNGKGNAADRGLAEMALLTPAA